MFPKSDEKTEDKNENKTKETKRRERVGGVKEGGMK